jgi:hypothetical protein
MIKTKAPVVGLLAILAVGSLAYGSSTTTVLGQEKKPRCSVSDIKIKSMKARYEASCSSCKPRLLGVAVLTNNCSSAIGVQLKLTGFDKAEEPVATTDFWPASIDDIPPGDYTFSLDSMLRYEPGIVTFSMTPIKVYRFHDE